MYAPFQNAPSRASHVDDRLMCSTYLVFFMRDDLLDEMPLFPYPDPPAQGGSGDHAAESFMAPSVSYSYDQVRTRTYSYYESQLWRVNVKEYMFLGSIVCSDWYAPPL